MTDDLMARLFELTDLATPFAVRVVATLRIPDLIESGTRDLGDLAAATGTDRDALGRLLRFLVHRDVFTEPAPEVFAVTELGRLLREDGEAWWRSRLNLGSFPARMDLAYSGLLHSIRTGEPAYAAVHGRSLWDDLDENPDHLQHFDTMMLVQLDRIAPQVAELYPWQTVDHVIDIGGGSGGMLVELLSAHPHLRGRLVDRPVPAKRTAGYLAASRVSDRADVVVGDFFASLPSGGDVYIISRALSDWNDQAVRTILRCCREAAGTGGRILIVEVLRPAPPYRTPFDLEMLVTVGGRERSVEDFGALAADANLSITSVLHGKAGLVLIECTPDSSPTADRA